MEAAHGADTPMDAAVEKGKGKAPAQDAMDEDESESDDNEEVSCSPFTYSFGTVANSLTG